MRLLKYNNGKVEFTKYLTRNIPAYAILSHTWGSDTEEVTLTDIVDGTWKDKTGYKKIEFCAAQAKRDRLQYFWVDSCCIDKSDRTDVDRSMRSMFHWYHNAARCYVYLSDVSINGYKQPGPLHRNIWESAFQRSRWHTRGWTLQELLAPSSVQFFSQEGKLLGDKRSLEQLIHQETKIPVQALRGAALSQFTVHERMEWAKTRETTVKEDRAYCLQGIFGIYLPVSYGEGEARAMHRLKKEIAEASNPERQRRAEQFDQSIDITSKNRQGRTPLSEAVENGRGAVVQLLLEGGADVESKDEHDRTLLSYAAADGRDAVVQLLLELGAAVESRDVLGRTPLSYAAGEGHETVVQQLLEKGADINSKDGGGQTQLMGAAAKQQPEHGADVKEQPSYPNRTPLSHAAENGHEAVVRQLIEHGASVESKDDHDRTPLLYAAESGHEAVVKLLLTTGKAEVNARTKDDCTPLAYAAKNGHRAAVEELLLARGVNVNARTRWRRTALSHAAEHGHATIVQVLLDIGVGDIDLEDIFGHTPLSYAAQKGHETVVERLLATGKVDINSTATPGSSTPLSYAAENGHGGVVKLLTAARKADIDLKALL